MLLIVTHNAVFVRAVGGTIQSMAKLMYNYRYKVLSFNSIIRYYMICFWLKGLIPLFRNSHYYEF